jgi:thiol-disulfide isomerase/thioredoxin
VVRSLTKGKPFPQLVSIFHETGKPLPLIEASTSDGKPLSWENYRNKVLVVGSWASWCSPCKHAMPYYEKLRRQLSGQGVVFVELNFDAERADYENWLAKNAGGYGFTFARVAEINKDELMQALKSCKMALPGFYVVGRDGNVVRGYFGFEGAAGDEDPRLIAALRAAGVDL